MNPDDRLTCAQLLESPYFDSFREDQIKRKAHNEGRNRRRQQVPLFKVEVLSKFFIFRFLPFKVRLGEHHDLIFALV